MYDMRVRIDIGLDFDGSYRLDWVPSDGPDSVDIPRSTLERWGKEREAFTVANLRWKRVVEVVDEHLYRTEQTRSTARTDPPHQQASAGQIRSSLRRR